MPLEPKGSLIKHSLPEILRETFKKSWTGEITFIREGIERKVYIRDGTVIFARSSDVNDRLGEVFLRVGKITIRQFEDVSRQIVEEGKRLGAILVESKILSPKGLLWGVKYQIREIVYDLFSWNTGQYKMAEGIELGQEIITLSIYTPKLIFEGIKRMTHWWHIQKDLPPLGTVMELDSEWKEKAANLDLAEREIILLNLVDSKKTMEQILKESPFTDFETARFLMGFLMTDIIRKATEHFEIPVGDEPNAYAKILGCYNLLFEEIVQDLSRRLDRQSRHKLNPYFLLARATYPELFRFADMDERGVLDLKVLAANLAKVENVHRPAYLQQGLQRLLDEILKGHELLTGSDSRRELETHLKGMVIEMTEGDRAS